MAEPLTGHWDCVVIGAGPAGLSAGLNLVRARRSVLMIDSNRPRHSATLQSHGFLTRDGASPLELRRLGREEFESYEDSTFAQAAVGSLDEAGDGYRVQAKGIRGGADVDITTSTVILASGLTETLPALPSMRAYYGTNLHSCIECDGFEKSDAPLALIGESDDLYERAILIAQFSSDLIVFTNGADVLDEADEAELTSRGIGVERRAIDDIVGERAVMTGLRLADGDVIARSGGFVRPQWSVQLSFADSLNLVTSDEERLVVDDRFQTSARGIFAAGDLVLGGLSQLIVAAGDGARAASGVNRSLLGI